MASSVQRETDAHCVFWLWGHNSSWISTSWPDSEQGILSEGDAKAERGSEEKKSDLWRGKKWLLHHDNGPVHSSCMIHDFLIKREMKIVPQPPCSSDLAPADFFLFTKLKSVLKVWRSEFVKEINENLLAELCSIPKEAFQECFQKKCCER